MSLAEKLDARPGDVLSVVGAGGKTTLIFRLARELACGKTLVTTTTRMYFPNRAEYDYLLINETPEPTGSGVYFLSGKPDKNGKATPYEHLSRVLNRFDYALIEADGAKGRLLKAWAEHEPVIPPETTKTVGVLNLNALGLTVTPENIHRPEEYIRLTGANPGGCVTVEQLRALTANGLFGKAVGEKILCIIGGPCFAGSEPYTFEGADRCVNL